MGYEVNQKNIARNRSGNFWANFLNFRRTVDIAGWRFNGIILLKNGLVVYELTGSQPIIREMKKTAIHSVRYKALANQTRICVIRHRARLISACKGKGDVISIDFLRKPGFLPG